MRWARLAWWAVLVLVAALPAIVGAVPFVGQDPLSASVYFVPKIVFASVLLAVALLFWLIAFLSGEIGLRSVPGKIPLIVLMGLGAASVVFSDNPLLSFFGRAEVLMGYYSWTLCTLAYVLVLQLTTNSPKMRSLTYAVVVGGVIVATISLFQHVGLDPIPQRETVHWLLARGYGTLGNPDHTGTFLVTPFVLALMLSFTEPTLARRSLMAIVAVVVGAALFITLTRGAWLGATFGIGMLAVFMKPWKTADHVVRWIFVSGTALIVALSAGVRSDVVKRFAELLTGSAAGSGRLIIWKDALTVIKSHPILGTGPDSFMIGWQKLNSLELWKVTRIPVILDDPHSLWLLIAATFGIPGFVAFVWFLGKALFGSKDVLRANAYGSQIYIGWLIACVAQLVALSFAMSLLPTLLILFVTVAVLDTPRARQRESSAVQRNVFTALAVGGTAVLLCVGVIWGWADYVHARVLATGDTVSLDRVLRVAPWDRAARLTRVNDTVRTASIAAAEGASTAQASVLDALESTDAFIQYDPAFSTSWEPKVRLQANVGRYLGEKFSRAAVKSADAGLERYKYDTALISQKAYALNDIGRGEEAVEALEPVWKLDSGNPLLGLLYVESLLAKGRSVDAAEAIEYLYKTFPRDSQVEAALETL